MVILGKDKLIKLKHKNLNNSKLITAINKLIYDLETFDYKNKFELKQIRPDADCVNSKGFYFFDISVHRILALMVFDKDEVTVIWVGNHDEYEVTFKSNKNTINKWLRKQQLI